MNTPQKECS